MGKGQRQREERRSAVCAEVVTEDAPKVTRLFDTERFYIVRYIAMVAMFIDHLAVVLASFGIMTTDIFFACRVLGRIAYPLFALQLVESFHATRDRVHHLKILVVLALVSELPYDIALNITTPTRFDVGGFYRQNTCFTLAVAFVFLMCFNYDWAKLFGRWFKSARVIRWSKRSVQFLLLGLFGLTAYALYSDYSGSGIMCVALFELSKHRKHPWFWRVVALLYIIGLQLSVPLALVPFALLLVLLIVNSRSKNDTAIKHTALVSERSKRFCRYFYPLHLALLAIFRVVLHVIVVSS